jgi:TRAP-type C4-dicarboxylate transport system substrate-binding protein
VFELPFMMNNAEATSKAFWEYITTMAPDEYKDTQVIALQVHGPGMFHTKAKQIKTADDVKGMKLRGPTRQITKMLGYLGATPVGMPLPGIPDALSKGTIEGAVIPWEVVPSVKVHELTKFHSEFDPAGGALYTTTFVMAMNKAKYNSLPPDLKKIIDNNSGMETSAWLGKAQQAGDVPGRKSAVDRNNAIYTIPAADAQEFKRKARLVEVEWVEDMNKRGFDGKKLLETAKALIEKHGKAGAAPAKAAPAKAAAKKG